MTEPSLPTELTYNVYPAFRQDSSDHRPRRVETVPHTLHVGYYIDLHIARLIAIGQFSCIDREETTKVSTAGRCLHGGFEATSSGSRRKYIT